MAGKPWLDEAHIASESPRCWVGSGAHLYGASHYRRTSYPLGSQGFIILILASTVTKILGLTLLNFVLEKLVVGCAVAMAVAYQSEFRRFQNNWGVASMGSCGSDPAALFLSMTV
jgi:DNA integrity scanning protein DisA with diadenylate cyclase activity